MAVDRSFSSDCLSFQVPLGCLKTALIRLLVKQTNLLANALRPIIVPLFPQHQSTEILGDLLCYAQKLEVSVQLKGRNELFVYFVSLQPEKTCAKLIIPLLMSEATGSGWTLLLVDISASTWNVCLLFSSDGAEP